MINQNDLQAVIERAKADIARKYVYVMMPIPQIETLIAGLEELQKALEEIAYYGELKLTTADDFVYHARTVLSTLTSPCTP